MQRRAIAAVSGGLAVILVGGVAQALASRTGTGGLAAIIGSQFAWILVVFVTSWGWAAGRVPQGALAGGLTGLGLIANYYAMQWALDGRQSAAAQFASSGGAAWTMAAVVGGALVGVFGAWAGMPVAEQPTLKAVGLTTPAVLIAVGPALWLWVNGQYLPSSDRWLAVVVFVLIGAVLLVIAVRLCGRRASVQALALSCLLAIAALGGLLLLQRSGLLYVTF